MCGIVCVSALCLISLSKRYIDISHSIMTFDLCFFVVVLARKKKYREEWEKSNSMCILKVILNLFVMCNKMIVDKLY